VPAAEFPTSFPLQVENKWVERAMLVAWGLTLFFICFALGTRHHKFPYFYHPDEPDKAAQIITGNFNYHHPMLLLATTQLVVEALHVPKKPQAVVETGRCVSAAFMAGATVMLSLLAYLWRGWRPAFVTGAALALHHQLYELAHYMKEDSALLFGMSAAFLMAMAYSQRASLWRAAVFGAACALAVSGKYLGIVMLGIAVPLLWVGSEPVVDPRPPGRRRGTHLALFFAVFFVVVAAVNYRMLLEHATFEKSLHREVGLVVTGQGDVTRSVPHALYWNVFIDNTTPVVWVLLVALYSAYWHRWRQLSLSRKLLVWFPIAYAIALSFSPKENDRYFLPATAIFTLLAAIGVEALPLLLADLGSAMGNWHPRRVLEPTRRNWIYVIGAVVLLVVQVTGWAATKPGWSQYDAAFVRDDIASLIAWMKNDLPPNAVVYADSRTGLPNPKRKKNAFRAGVVPQKLVISKLASDKGTLEEIRAQGATHVAISESSYGRFFRKDLRAKEQNQKDFLRAKSFYEDLLRNGELLFERERGTVIYLHPGIRVYRLPGTENPAEPH
jgi:dolichyl-phosphate-mannose-protein mannosyltransferase